MDLKISVKLYFGLFPFPQCPLSRIFLKRPDSRFFFFFVFLLSRPIFAEAWGHLPLPAVDLDSRSGSCMPELVVRDEGINLITLLI